MKRLAIICAAALIGMGAAAAHAQDASTITGALASATNLLGQTIGDAALDRESVMVTATGRAKLPAPLSDSYAFNVEGAASSAVGASSIRDARMKQLRDVAQRFGVDMEVGKSGFAYEVDQKAQAEQQRQLQTDRAAHPGVFVPFNPEDAPKQFVARTGVRFSEPSGEKMAAFLDALKAAGVENFDEMLGSPNQNIFRQTMQVLGFGAVEQVDDAVWAKASAAAMESARAQADVLAKAAGRTLGPAKQITFLIKTAQGGDASVSVAVRYSFAPLKTP